MPKLTKQIKKDTVVKVLVGKNKGKQGRVLRVIREEKMPVKVVVEGVNVVRKHVKANPNAGEQGGIVPKEMPIDISNVEIV